MSLLIENVFYPETVLPGGTFEVEAEVQFLEAKPGAHWYVKITDVATSGQPFYLHHEAWGVIGSWGSIFCGLRPGFYMPDRPWNLRVEVGQWDFWLNKIVAPLEVRYITIYNDTPPIVCPEGYYYDPTLGECVEIKEATNWTKLAIAGMGLLVVASVIFGKAKKESTTTS